MAMKWCKSRGKMLLLCIPPAGPMAWHLGVLLQVAAVKRLAHTDAKLRELFIRVRRW
jgi:hypothetical protein